MGPSWSVGPQRGFLLVVCVACLLRMHARAAERKERNRGLFGVLQLVVRFLNSRVDNAQALLSLCVSATPPGHRNAGMGQDVRATDVSEWALAPPSTTPPQVQCFLGAASCVLRLQPDCVVVCLIGFVEWLCSRRWCLQCFGWALSIGSFATCSTCCTWFAAAWLCTPPAFGVCCFNSGSCRTLNSQRLARATEAQRVTYSASRRLEGHLRHRWQHSNSRRALLARARTDREVRDM